MKFVDTQVVFEEIPDEITLCVNVSNCKFHCPECHSKHLWGDIGEELNNDSIDVLLKKNRGVSCICFMGHEDENGWKQIVGFANHIKESNKKMKVGMYSGCNSLPLDELKILDYVKVGPYIAEYGPLNSVTTNQKMFKNVGDSWKDITNYYQTKK